MKKLVLPFVFVLSLTFSFAQTGGKTLKKDCHAEACQELAIWEGLYDDLSETEVEGIYNWAFNECNNN